MSAGLRAISRSTITPIPIPSAIAPQFVGKPACGGQRELVLLAILSGPHRALAETGRECRALRPMPTRSRNAKPDERRSNSSWQTQRTISGELCTELDRCWRGPATVTAEDW